MWSWRRIIQFLGCAGLAFGATCALAQQDAQQAQQSDAAQHSYWDCVAPLCTYEAPKPGDKNKEPRPYGGGTPLDVILSTRYWTDVPEAKDFVKATRPPEDALQYQSTGGKDISRPKPKTAAELQDMQDELERAGAAADRAAGIKSHFHVEPKKKLSAARQSKKKDLDTPLAASSFPKQQ